MERGTPISYKNVTLQDGFWKHRQEINRTVTLQAVYDRFEETGRFAALRCVCDYEKGKEPHIFWDSDVAKWLESAAYILQKAPDAKLEQLVDETVALILQSQDESGYFNSYFLVCEPDNRFGNRDAHELYCAGHLMEAAVAYFEATGKDAFLRGMCKYADYIERVFKLEDSAEFAACGHEEIELALAALYRCTGETRYLELARHFVEVRGRDERDDNPLYWAHPSYSQTHLPVREQETAEGHCVRAMYLYCAMADLALETGDESLLQALRTLFHNVVDKRMYITGGIGSSNAGEAFTIDYDLPNATSYTETCAAIGLALFARRMSLLEPDSLYADIAEKALYNGVLSGVSLDGKAFFYENPLERDPLQFDRDVSVRSGKTHYPILERQEVFGCSCCPPNITRVMASLGSFLYSKSGDTLFIHQYTANTAQPDAGFTLTQQTDYPASGKVRIMAEGGQGKTLALRIPQWCASFSVSLNGGAVAAEPRKGYVYIPLQEPRCEIQLTLDMPARLMEANPAVQADAGRVCLTRGPLVYCLEERDNGKLLRSLAVDSALDCTLCYDEGMQAYAIETDGFRRSAASDALYLPYAKRWESTRLRFIPYFAFANRGVGEMLVWVQARE